MQRAIAAARLRTLLDDDPASDQVRSAQIGERSLIAPAGVYRRVPPAYADTLQATAETRQSFDTYMRALQQSYDAIHCVALHDATVIGQGSVVTADGLLLRESAAEFLAHCRVPDGVQAIGDQRWQFRAPRVTHIDATCLLVKRPWFRNFGHWLVDCATVLAMLGAHARRHGWFIVTGAYEDATMRRIVQETIACLAPGVPVLEHPDHAAWQVADLRYVMPLHVPPLFKLPAALQRLRRLILPQHADPRRAERTATRRLYLSRRDAGVRVIANEDALSEPLARFGFETVFLRDRTLAEQARLFSEASAIVGVKGAALANIVFCRPDCVVMVLSPGDFPDPFFWDIAGQAGLRYGELFGQMTTDLPAGRNDFVVDPGAVERMLETLLDPA